MKKFLQYVVIFPFQNVFFKLSNHLIDLNFFGKFFRIFDSFIFQLKTNFLMKRLQFVHLIILGVSIAISLDFYFFDL